MTRPLWRLRGGLHALLVLGALGLCLQPPVIRTAYDAGYRLGHALHGVARTAG